MEVDSTGMGEKIKAYVCIITTKLIDMQVRKQNVLLLQIWTVCLQVWSVVACIINENY